MIGLLAVLVVLFWVCMVALWVGAIRHLNKLDREQGITYYDYTCTHISQQAQQYDRYNRLAGNDDNPRNPMRGPR